MLLPRLSALAHPQRLALFRLLMRRFPDRVAAGELAEALDLRPSTLSAYLAALVQAGLLTQHREGTSLRYAIDMTGAQQTVQHLFLDCCRARPDLCAPLTAATEQQTTPLPDQKFRVLFVCTGNSARSIMAESILQSVASDRFSAQSAGTDPASRLNPDALTLLQARGHDVSGLRAKNLAEFQTPGTPRFDFVFTVCNHAANEDCPLWSGQPISAHWGMPDPVSAQGTPAERGLAFRQTYEVLHRRITAFAALPFATLDRASLQHAIDDIALTETGSSK